MAWLFLVLKLTKNKEYYIAKIMKNEDAYKLRSGLIGRIKVF